MNFFIYKKLLIIIILPVILSGCSLTLKTKKNVTVGGIFKSIDAAESWQSRSAVPSVGERSDSLVANSVNFMIFDPSDHLTIYSGIRDRGMYVTWDGGAAWRPLLTGKGTVVAAVVDPKSPCIIYAAVSKGIYKSSDCGRRWEMVFSEKRDNAAIVDLDIDFYDTENIFASMKTGGRGEIIASRDSGLSWQVLKGDFQQGMRDLYINPQDTRVMYAALDRGLAKTEDQGITWKDLSKFLREAGLQNGEIVYDLIFLPESPDSFLTVTKYGILRSENGGQDWQSYILLQQPNSAQILSMAINPKNENEIYYTTAKGIYKSVDGGGNWITLSSPTSFAPRYIKMDPVDANILYLGSWQIVK